MQDWGRPVPLFTSPSHHLLGTDLAYASLMGRPGPAPGERHGEGRQAHWPAGRGHGSVDEGPLSTSLCRHRPHHSPAPGREPIHLGHGMQEGWDFSFEGDMEFTSGNISLMSSLRVEGLSGINHRQRGRQLRAPGPIPQGLILSGNFRTSPGLKTRMKITLEVPRAVLYHSLKTSCWRLQPFVRT